MTRLLNDLRRYTIYIIRLKILQLTEKDSIYSSTFEKSLFALNGIRLKILQLTEKDSIYSSTSEKSLFTLYVYILFPDDEYDASGLSIYLTTHEPQFFASIYLFSTDFVLPQKTKGNKNIAVLYLFIFYYETFFK